MVIEEAPSISFQLLILAFIFLIKWMGLINGYHVYLFFILVKKSKIHGSIESMQIVNKRARIQIGIEAASFLHAKF